MNGLITAITDRIRKLEPNAEIILFGSEARNEATSDSDIDLLILLDRSEISVELEAELSAPLYDLEFEFGKIISPIILPKYKWNTSHKATPFYESVHQQGITL